MVTSTSTPASMLMMICLTTSVGALRSIRRLCILISYMSHVLLPSPQGVFRVVTLRVLVGRRTGPLTRRGLDFARSQGDADLVDFRALAEILLGLLERHLCA